MWIVSELTDIKKDHGLFSGIDSLADSTNVGDYLMTSDSLQNPSSIIQPLAKDNADKVVIGEMLVNSRTVIVDTNLARTYNIRNSDTNVKKYLINLLKVLSQE